MLTEEEKKILGTELFGYIDQGNLKGVASVLGKDADINFKINGKTPIYYASEKGKFEIVKFLLEKGADINLAYDRLGKTVLYHAAGQGNFEVVKLLLESGATIKKGQEIALSSKPHWIAANNGYNDIVKFFLDRTKFNSDDITQLFHPAARDCNEQLVKMLLKKEVGADLNKCLSVVMEFINDKHGAFDNPDEREYRKNLAILLVEEGADASKIAEGRFGKELVVRLAGNNKNIVALYGIAIKERDEERIGIIIEKIAHDKELFEMIKAAIHKEEDATFLLYIAAERGYTELVETCINKGGKINASFKNKKTALVVASENGHCEVVKLLLENNADIYAVAGLFRETTSLHYWEPHFAAVWEDHSEVVKVFLDHGEVTVRSENRSNKTLLHTAARCGSVKVIELLLERGADMNATDKDKNPLYIAVKEGRFEAAETLLKHGAVSWWINFNEGKFTPEQVTELNSIKPEKDLIMKNLAAVVLDGSKRSNKNLSVDQFNMIKIDIENKLQGLLIKNPTQDNIRMAKMLVEGDLPEMLVAAEQTKAASNSGLDKKFVAPVQKKHVEQTLKAETKPKKELIVKNLADRIISNFKQNSFITLPEHVLDVIRVRVQDQLREQLPENPSEHQKQAAQEGAQEFVKKMDLQEIMFSYFVSQTQHVKEGVETKEAGTKEPQSNFYSPEVVNADSKKKAL